MFQNVKVDIIYYKTNTDFEMEFNLCGCCRMRLLTDKSPDRRTAVHSLARAVSRSRVIMVVGPLFSNESIIKLCSGALKTELTLLDNKAYGIENDENIEILKNSTPLITPEGYFGGCIIESGPQTMILISDNKNIRKSIMTTLIHPYIKEMCANELTQDISLHSLDDSENATEPPSKATNEEQTDEPSEEISQAEIEPVFEDDAKEDLITEEYNQEGDFPKDLLLEQALEDDAELFENETLEDLIHTDDQEPEPTYEDLEDTENAEDDATGFIFGDEDDQEPDEEPSISYDESNDEASAFYTEEDDEIANIADDIALSASEAMIKGIISDADEDYEDIDEEDESDRPDDDDAEKFRIMRRARFINIPIAVIVAILLVLLAVACYCIFYVPAKNGIPAAEYLNDIFNTLFG